MTIPRLASSKAADSRGRSRHVTRSASATSVSLLFLGAALACGPHEAATIQDSAAIRDVGSLEGVRAVSSGPGGQPAQPSNAGADRALTDSVRAQLQLMPAMNTQQLTAILPTHIRMVASLLSRQAHEWPTGDHPGKSAPSATIDSVRADLARLPVMTAPQLGQAMPAHLERVQRIIRN